MNEYTEHHTRRENMPGLTLPDTLNYDTIRSGSTRRWATEHLTRSSGNGLRSNAPRKKPKSRVREMPGSSLPHKLRKSRSVAQRLFHMYRKVEAARALSRRALTYNYAQSEPAMHVAMASKITGTQHSFEVANEALQIFSGRGLTPAYPIE